MRLVYSCFVFFFFKQKTAYEMRISDWSSDVCSSDLTLPCLRRRGSKGPRLPPLLQGLSPTRMPHEPPHHPPRVRRGGDICCDALRIEPVPGQRLGARPHVAAHVHGAELGMELHPPHRLAPAEGVARSEEHTSELQSLMRISYAVFRLKKK